MEIRCYNAKTKKYYIKEVELTEEELQKQFEENKIAKLNELETFITNEKEKGFIYDDKPFKLDSVAQNRINMLATAVSLGANVFPLEWFTANGEFGTITLENVEDFSVWYASATSKILEIEMKETNYRYQIEQATTQEELDKIKFE